MDLYFFGQEANLSAVNGGSVSDPASSPAALAVGAYDVDNPRPIEPFSSDGPTIDGRLKPDIAAPDGVMNDVFNPFFGTSASAPHVAGAAALVKGAFPSMTADQIQGLLTCPRLGWRTGRSGQPLRLRPSRPGATRLVAADRDVARAGPGNDGVRAQRPVLGPGGFVADTPERPETGS